MVCESYSNYLVKIENILNYVLKKAQTQIVAIVKSAQNNFSR